jgi:flagellar biosynthetic protein FliO
MPPHADALMAAVSNNDHVSMLSLLGRLVVSLLVVLLVLWVLAQVVRRRGLPGSRGPGGKRSRPRQVDVLSRQSLGKGQTLVTVRTEDRVLLLGVTPQSITTLSELDAEALGELGALGPADDGAIEVKALRTGPLPALSAGSLRMATGAASQAWSDRLDRWRALTVRR